MEFLRPVSLVVSTFHIDECRRILHYVSWDGRLGRTVFLNPQSILVVDDDENLRRLLLTSFHEEGFRVLTATGGREALDRLQIEKPQCLLLDLGMPDLGGLDLLQALHKDPPSPDLLIVVLSGTSDLDLKLACLAAGAHEYLVKPVDVREIVARVQRFLKMVEEFRKTTPPPPQVEKRYLVPVMTLDKDSSHGTVDLIGSTGDSFRASNPTTACTAWKTSSAAAAWDMSSKPMKSRWTAL